MRGILGLPGLIFGMAASAQPAKVDVSPLQPGVYSNEEQVYFEREAGRTPPPSLFLEVAPDGSARAVDAFGAPAALPRGDLVQHDRGLIRHHLSGEPTLELRRARPVSCWVAIPREARKPDGSIDWYFVRDLRLHDQGGRVNAGGGSSGARPLVLRMRNVVWAQGPNRPSVVLYVHTPDEPDRAAAYSWADPDAKRIGINLRWMQASCTIDESKGGALQ